MLRTLVATPPRPPPERPFLPEAPPYQLPIVPGHEDPGYQRRDVRAKQRHDWDD
jgi:hypothetical protein